MNVTILPHAAGIASSDLLATRKRLDRLAWLLDNAVRIPGTGIRLGADAALGLIPGVGSAATTMVSAWIIREAWRMDIPVSTLMRMIAYVGFDGLISLVPVVGNVMDIFWRANRKNMALLAEHLDREATLRGRS